MPKITFMGAGSSVFAKNVLGDCMTSPIMENSEITAPEPIVACIKEFVSSIRNDWNKLSEPLARALDQNTSFIEALLEQLDELFTTEQL